VGTFVLEEAIGVGGMGAVFRALDVQLDRHVALKLLPPDQTADPEIVQRFYQEGRSAAQLDHENIARVYSIGQDGSHHYIAFEYIEGITVRRRVDEAGPLPVGEAVDIALQIAQALVHAAGRGVVHRDIKPSNIILTPQGRAKLVDMGLARRFEREADRGLTQSGMTLGTFDYISPEQARDPRDVDVRSDLYSLGCTLFHMLTGRPPFAGGTVLQKLLQHQEEPPPEIRGINPSVPPELARIIGRLLAKDRDRRYHSPEQLVRDLLAIAGRLGVPVLAADQHGWITAGHRVTWEHHLIWFVPVLAFCVVVAGLVWWGREGNKPVSTEGGLGSSRSSRSEVSSKSRSLAGPGEGSIASSTGDDEESAPPVLAPPRNILVRPGDDLLAAIAMAPPRSIITLNDDGPYRLGGRTLGSREPELLLNRDVTIKADAGYRPVLSFAADVPQRDGTPIALLAFSGGNVTIEGLTFELEPEGPDGNVAAVSAQDTELTLRGCFFRQSAVRTGRNRAALKLRTAKTVVDSGDRPPRIFADACHFDGGQVGIVAEGPVDLQVRDCTLGPGSPSIWIDNTQSAVPVPAEVRLRRSSLMAGSGPVIELEGALARVLVDDCVIASAGNAQPTLVATDNPRNLIWHGRANLYGRIRAFLESFQKLEGGEPIVDFDRWRDTLTEPRETDSRAVSSAVWRSPHPLQELVLEQEEPSLAFRLADEFTQAPRFGARQGPYGSRLAEPIAASGRQESPAAVARAPAQPFERSPDPAPLDPSPRSGETSPPTGTDTAQAANSIAKSGPSLPMPEAAGQVTTTDLPAMPPMANSPDLDPGPAAPADPSKTDAADGSSRPIKKVDPVIKATAEAGTATTRTPRKDATEKVIRSSEQLIALLSGKGGTIRIAQEADLELPATELSGPGPWRIEAETGLGSGRPRIRFHPSSFASRPPTAWSVLFNLQSGKLRLQGIDIMVPTQDAEAPPTGPQAAIGLSAGTELELADCTITVSNSSPNSAAVVVQPEAALPPVGQRDRAGPGRRATITIVDTFIRSAGDGIAVSSGRLLELQLRNVIAGTDGSLLHAMGSSQIDRNTTALNVKIERSLARNRGGLIYLESTQDEKELPLTNIEVVRSTFSTAGPSPLFRLDGQGPMDGLRDRIVWNAVRAAYDQILTYRRDQILQTGVSPREYTRADWRTAFDPRDESPLVDGVRYQRKLELWRSARTLTRDDLRLDPRSLAADRSPDLSRIPDAPPVDS
jgi:serine/threonine-protein kinase